MSIEADYIQGLGSHRSRIDQQQHSPATSTPPATPMKSPSPLMATFVADGSSGLQVIDVSNPASPSLTATYTTSGSAIDVALSADGTPLYIHSADCRSLMSASPPAVVTATYDTRGHALGVDPLRRWQRFPCDVQGRLDIDSATAMKCTTATLDPPQAGPHPLKRWQQMVADKQVCKSLMQHVAVALRHLRHHRLAYEVALSADGNTVQANWGSGLQIIVAATPPAHHSPPHTTPLAVPIRSPSPLWQHRLRWCTKAVCRS